MYRFHLEGGVKIGYYMQVYKEIGDDMRVIEYV